MKNIIFLVNLMIIIVLTIISCDGKAKRIQKIQETISANEMDQSENRIRFDSEKFFNARLKERIYKKPIAVIEELEKIYNTAYELYLKIESLPFKSYIGNDMSNDEYNKLTNNEKKAMNETNDKIEQENEQRRQLVKQYNQLASEYHNLIKDNEISLLDIQLYKNFYDKENKIDIIKNLYLILDPIRMPHLSSWPTIEIIHTTSQENEGTRAAIEKLLQATGNTIPENDNIDEEETQQ